MATRLELAVAIAIRQFAMRLVQRARRDIDAGLPQALNKEHPGKRRRILAPDESARLASTFPGSCRE